MRKRIGRGRKPTPRPTEKVQDNSPETFSVGDARCPLCGKPIKGTKGAKVYHWKCLYDDMKENREKTSKPV